jgi:hypothetical protein
MVQIRQMRRKSLGQAEGGEACKDSQRHEQLYLSVGHLEDLVRKDENVKPWCHEWQELELVNTRVLEVEVTR